MAPSVDAFEQTQKLQENSLIKSYFLLKHNHINLQKYSDLAGGAGLSFERTTALKGLV